MSRGYRLAGYDASGNELTDRDVLSPDELAEDYGWVNRSRVHVDIDPDVLAEVVRLQGGAS